jgi:hypothetical protein
MLQIMLVNVHLRSVYAFGDDFELVWQNPNVSEDDAKADTDSMEAGSLAMV